MSLLGHNQFFILKFSVDVFGYQKKLKDLRVYLFSGEKLNRLLGLVLKTGTDRCMSGLVARAYIDLGSLFPRRWGIQSGRIIPDTPNILRVSLRLRAWCRF